MTTELGGVNNEHSGLIMSPKNHTNVVGHALNTHVDPGVLPKNTDPPAQLKIAQISSTQKEKSSVCHQQQEIIKAMKNILEKYFEDNFFSQTHVIYSGHNNHNT